METVIRVTAVYLFLMVALRIIGKRDVGQLAPFDLVILLLIPELLAHALTQEDYSLTNGFIGVSTLLSLAFLTSVVDYLSKGAADIVEGRPTVLVRHGNLVAANLNRERVSPEEIVAQMRQSGLERVEQVKWGILETDGKISFVPWEPGGTPVKPGEELVV